MKKQIVQLVILPIGIIVGIGVGMLISKPQIAQRQEMIEQLMIQMQTSKDESEETIRKASQEIARYKNELARNKDALMQAITQLSSVKAELENVRSQGQPGEPTTVARAESTAPAAAAGTVEYTVKEGDSLWNIAANELGNGIRFKEIIDLNQGITENTVLREGMKLRIPAK